MLSSRAVPAFLLCLALVGASLVEPGSAQQGSTTPEGGQAEAAAPQAPPQTGEAQTQPTFRTGINFVRVDVIVGDRKDEPVTDLSQKDFELFEDGKPREIEQFSLVRTDGNPRPGAPPPRAIRNAADEEIEASREDTRVFVIFLDDYHVRRANSISIREPLKRFVQNQLRPNDMVAVMYPLTPVTVMSFTRNHNTILTAVERFTGRKFDYTPMNEIEYQYQRLSTEEIERIRNDVVLTALEGLSVRLGALREGRKSVVFVSEGFTALLPPQMRRADASMPANPLEVERQARAQDSPREYTAEWFNMTDIFQKMRNVFNAANRNNTSIYSLDPRGLAPFEYGFDDLPGGPPPSFATDSRALRMTQDTLRTLSEETDGRAIVNRNTLDQGLAQVTRDSSYYYLLGYTSQAPTDGKFHEISVRVRRRDTNVRARKGFWAVTNEDVIRAANPTPEIAKPVQTALASISTSVQAGKYVRTWVGAERGESGKTRVTLVWEPLAMPPGDRREPAMHVSLMAATSAGSLVFRGRAPEKSSTTPSAATGPLTAGPRRLVFEAPPGKLELRMTVEGASGGTLDQEIRDFVVPDLTTPQVVLSTPRVYRARTLPELRLIVADANAVPAAGREFSRTERVLVRFNAYAPGTEKPQATAALLNRGGKKMSDLAVSVTDADQGMHEITLALASVPAGEYLVEITVKGASGDVKELVPFRVTS
jgi:VWFA-related protein